MPRAQKSTKRVRSKSVPPFGSKAHKAGVQKLDTDGPDEGLFKLTVDAFYKKLKQVEEEKTKTEGDGRRMARIWDAVDESQGFQKDVAHLLRIVEERVNEEEASTRIQILVSEAICANYELRESLDTVLDMVS